MSAPQVNRWWVVLSWTVTLLCVASMAIREMQVALLLASNDRYIEKTVVQNVAWHCRW